MTHRACAENARKSEVGPIPSTDVVVVDRAQKAAATAARVRFLVMKRC